MNASALEIVLRLMVALLATGGAILIVHGLVLHLMRPRQIWLYKAVILTVLAVWRWGILALGFQSDVNGWAWTLEWVQPVNALLLGLLIFGSILLALAMLLGWTLPLNHRPVCRRDLEDPPLQHATGP